MKKFHFCIAIIFSIQCFFAVTNAQSIAISNNGSAPDSSALLDVKSVTKGFLPPRMTSIQRDAINKPAAGLIVYDTDRKGLFLYDSTGWKILQAIDPNSPASYANQQNTIPPGLVDGSDFYADELGYSVATFGDYAFIGAKGAYNRPGYVLVYRRTGDNWNYLQVIKPNTALANMSFGATVKAKEGYLFISAPGDQNASAVKSGAVYVYALNAGSWAYQAKLLPNAATPNLLFGTYIDVNTNADQLVSYATGNSQASIFRRSGTNWLLQQTITVSSVMDLSMQPDGDAVAFGVLSSSETINSVSYTRPGHVSLYVKSGSIYSFAVNIINPTPQNNDRFGSKLKFGQNYGTLDYILLAGSASQLQIGSISISNPVNYNFSGTYSASFNGNDGFGTSAIAATSPYTNNFYYSGVGENFLVGDDERIGIYSSGATAAWFAEKGGNIKLPEAVSYINFGTLYSLDAWASSADSFNNTQPTYIVVGTPYANDGKGAFYFFKF